MKKLAAPLLLFLSTLFVLWAASCVSAKFLNDDTLITLTYAKNLARGNGFVFNHPPAVLGTTTPLLTLLTALLASLFPWAGLPQLAVVFTALCLAALPWTFYFFREAFGLKAWHAIVMGWVTVISAAYNLLGMEAYLFAFLLAAALGLYLSGRLFLSGLLCGLLFLTRGEGILLPGLLGLVFLAETWHKTRGLTFQALKPLLWMALGFCIPLFLWFVYSQVVFGSFLPNTLAGKISQAASGRWSTFSHRLWYEWIRQWGAPFRIPALFNLNVWWLLVGLGLLYALRRRSWLLLILAWTVLYIAGYSLLRVAGYGWYAFPIVLVLNLFFALGLVWIGEFLSGWLRNRLAFSALYAALLLAALLTWGRPAAAYLVTEKGDSRGPAYQALSQWFNQHARPTDSVAYIEVGYLAYYTDNRIIDLAGLNTPQFLQYIRRGDLTTGFWETLPDYYVSLPDFDWALGDLLKDPRFARLYRPAANLPGPRQTDFTIYEKIK